MASKRCGKCKEIKLITAFAKNQSRKSGIHNECKTCQVVYNRIWHIQKNYKMTKENALAIVAKIEQEAFCQICGELLTLTKTGYAIDHSHSTGEFRGLLCVSCNKGLGCLKDDLYVIAKAYKYLERHGS